MLPFFRRIRKSLLNSGRLTRYLVYAGGEILLVVIGILIALQINNWNEQKKVKAFETKMLTEIRNQLQQDTAYFQMLISRCTRIDTSAARIIEFYTSGSDDRQYFEQHAHNLHWGYIFNFNNGAYDALKASGVEKISNDSLRTALIGLYDFWFPRTKELLDFHRSPQIRVLEEELEYAIFGNAVSIGDDGSGSLGYGAYRLGSLKDPVFMRYLHLQRDQALDGIGRIRVSIRQASEVLALLDRELGVE